MLDQAKLLGDFYARLLQARRYDIASCDGLDPIYKQLLEATTVKLPIAGRFLFGEGFQDSVKGASKAIEENGN